MSAKYSISKALPIFLIIMFILTGIQPVQAVSASPLAISGDLLWANRMGGSQDDQGNSIAVDSSGNIYTTGLFTGTADFGAISLTSAGGSDIFVTKMDSSGNFLWAKNMGGAGNDEGRSIAVDANGNLYTTGHFYASADFDPDPANVFTLNSGGGYDIFISMLDSNGNFVWAKNTGSLADDLGVGIAVTSNNVYITGALAGPVNYDIGVFKFDLNGNIIWGKSMGGAGTDYGLGIGIDLLGNVYTTGAFAGIVDFDPGAAATNLTSAGSSDIFVSKLDTNGNFVWARSMGGTGSDFGYGIALNASGGSVYITGDYEGAADFGATHLVSAGGFDGFVAEYNGYLGIPVWVKSMGGPDTDYGLGVAVDANNNVYTTGGFSNPATFGTTSLTSAGAYDIFVNKLNSDGSYSWTQGMGGTQNDVGRGIAVSSTGIYTTGAFINTVDFDPGVNTFSLTSSGGAVSGDVFVSKLKNYTGVYYVKPIASGTGDCESWLNACTLQSALRFAGSGDTIWVAQGTYKPTIGADRAATFQLKFDVGVYGGFAGTETTLDQRNPATNLTILSGDLASNDNGNIQYDEPTRADNSYHVVTGATGATLDGFTITAGNANGASTNSSGSGMLNLYSSPILMNITFSGNSAGAGGGMYNHSSNPTLTNVTFSNNSAFASGGGIENTSSNPKLTNVTFSGNSTGGSGGGMRNYSSNPTLKNVTFSGNSASVSGGGIYNNNSYPQIFNSIFWGNTAPNFQQIWNEVGDVSVATIRDSVVQHGISFNSDSARIITTDPKLGTLGNYGGSTQTFPLLVGSSAINTGNDDVSVCPVTDQRGITRPQGAHCDIGAYEYNYSGVYYVKPIASGTGNCQSWANACILQTALFTASSGDEIWVRQGTHKPIAGTDRAATFQLKNGVAIYGGFAGTETARDQRNPATNPTILSGDLVGNDNINDMLGPTYTDNSFHVVTGTTGATLDGFTITGGNANDVYPNNAGGGMFNLSSSPTLKNIIFYGNVSLSSTSSAGGGMANYSSNPTLTNITFSYNCGYKGGGMFNSSSNPILTNITFFNNCAVFGGGMFNSSSNPILTNITTHDNNAQYGGGMFNTGGNPQIRNSIFWLNFGGEIDNNVNNDVFGSISYPAIANSVVQDGCPIASTCMDIVTTDPMLGGIGNYGGFTQTSSLLAGSSAIDMGDDTICAAAAGAPDYGAGGLDQRGITRPQGAHCDIGAYEKTPVFADVSLSYWANSFIERLYNAGITGGCTSSPLNYCPGNTVTRTQMAIFLLRGMHGSGYTPPAATGTKFNDVPLGSFGAAWIEQLAAEGITSGCGNGNYCPNQTVSRAQMAIFLVRAKHGSGFVPPAATGIFPDVPVGSFGANYIEQLVADGITSGCGGGNFCPSMMVKRNSMAVFLVKAFNLP